MPQRRCLLDLRRLLLYLPRHPLIFDTCGGDSIINCGRDLQTFFQYALCICFILQILSLNVFLHLFESLELMIGLFRVRLSIIQLLVLEKVFIRHNLRCKLRLNQLLLIYCRLIIKWNLFGLTGRGSPRGSPCRFLGLRSLALCRRFITESFLSFFITWGVRFVNLLDLIQYFLLFLNVLDLTLSFLSGLLTLLLFNLLL